MSQSPLFSGLEEETTEASEDPGTQSSTSSDSSSCSMFITQKNPLPSKPFELFSITQGNLDLWSPSTISSPSASPTPSLKDVYDCSQNEDDIPSVGHSPSNSPEPSN